MALTYSTLTTKIRDYCEVDSNVFTSTIVDGFISDAEFRILRDVDSDNNRSYAQADIVAGQRYVNTPLINDETLIIRSVQITNSAYVIMLVRLLDQPSNHLLLHLHFRL